MTTRTPAQANPITDGVIWKEMLRYFFPLLFGTLFQQLYNTVDAIVVGRYVGKIALSAVGGTSEQMVSLLFGFFLGLTSGVSVIVAQFYGAKQNRDVSLAVHTGVALSLAAGIVTTILGLLCTRGFVSALHTPAEVVDGTVLYLRIVFIGMVPNLFYNIGASVLRAVGDSRRPFYYLVISCTANIFLDLFLVVVCNMAIAGVAVATVLSQLLSALLVLRALTRTTACYRLRIADIRFDRRMLHRMLSIGIPGGLQSAMYRISNILVQAAINGFGTDTVAAWTAVGKADIIVWLVLSAFGVTITTFAGQNFGAGHIRRVRQSVRSALLITAAIIVFLELILFVFGHAFLSLFSTDTAVISTGTQMLHYFARYYWLFVCIEIFAGALRGLGEVLVPTVLDLLGICALRTVWLLFYVPRHHVIHSVLVSYPLSWLVTSVLFVCYYLYFMAKKGFLKRKNA